MNRMPDLPADDAEVTMREWMALVSAILGAFMAILDIQITNSSLAEIEGAIGATTDEGSWISTGYLMAEIIVIPLTGWLGSIFGLRRYLVFNSFFFVLFSIGCALSHSLNQMIWFRVGQGFTGGVLIPTAITIVRTRIPRKKQPLGIALFGLVATFAPAIGPTIGGWLTDNLGWQYLFYLNIGPGILAISLQLYALPKQTMYLEDLKKGDWAGIICMAIGFSSLTYILEEGQRKEWFESPLILRLSILSFTMITSFIIIELTSKTPFINLKLLGRRSVGAPVFLMSVVGAVMYGSIFVIPVYLAQVQGYNAQQIGLVVMYSGLPQLLVFPMTPFLMQRIDPRLMVAIGASLFAISCYMNVDLTHDVAMDQLIIPQLFRAVGQPLFMMPLNQLATAGLSGRDTADASSLSNMIRNLGGSIGIATLSTVIQNREQFHFSVVAERITQNSQAAAAHLNSMAGPFIRAGSDATLAHQQALGLLANQVRREAYVMAYGDAFFVLAALLVLSLGVVMILPKPVRAPKGANADLAAH